MIHRTALLFLALALCACQSSAQPVPSGGSLKPLSQKKLTIAEPSDVAVAEDGQSLYIVSDNGYLCQTDLDGKILRTSPITGYDFEGCFQKGAYIYVSEERTRHFLKLNVSDLRQTASFTVQQFGGRNKGFESLTYNPVREVMVSVLERDPVELYELDPVSFAVKNQVPLTGYKDVSAATFFKGKLWILSDEGMSLTRVNPSTYEAEKSWSFPILNPEGVAFLNEGTLLIVSDDMQTLFTFSTQGLFE